MREFREIDEWLSKRGHVHAIPVVESLPEPTFRMQGQLFVSFSSNNYLGLAKHPQLIASAREGLERHGVGNCESRLLGGELEIYDRLETKLARLKGKETALVFATGFLTNLGVLSSLVKAGQLARVYGYRTRKRHTYAFFSDEYNHISIREGIRLSDADRQTYRHLDLNHLESLLKTSQATAKIIVTDGVFSQDGDIAPLPELIALAERFNTMVYVDDAHGTGVLGATGRGTAEHFGIGSERLINMGTLSKAYGAIGGFVATDKYIGDLLRLTCSAYGFTSTLPPDQVNAIDKAIDVVADMPEYRHRLWENQRYFVNCMRRLPYRLASTDTPIVPILIGNELVADIIASQLRKERIHVDSVKFPAVPRRQARLRIILNAGHTRRQIDKLVWVLGEQRYYYDEHMQTRLSNSQWPNENASSGKESRSLRTQVIDT